MKNNKGIVNYMEKAIRLVNPKIDTEQVFLLTLTQWLEYLETMSSFYLELGRYLADYYKETSLRSDVYNLLDKSKDIHIVVVNPDQAPFVAKDFMAPSPGNPINCDPYIQNLEYEAIIIVELNMGLVYHYVRVDPENVTRH